MPNFSWNLIPPRLKDFKYSDLDRLRLRNIITGILHTYHTCFPLPIHAIAVALLKYREWHPTCHDSPSLKTTFWHTPQFDSILALCLVRAELSMTTSGEHSYSYAFQDQGEQLLVFHQTTKVRLSNRSCLSFSSLPCRMHSTPDVYLGRAVMHQRLTRSAMRSATWSVMSHRLGILGLNMK